jgi:small subunit ribosomal protein S16
MIKIRLVRSGVRNNPFYRIVAIDSHAKAKGTPIEKLGYWKPSDKTIKIDKKKVQSWVEKGAQVSTAVSTLLEK